MSNLTIKEYEDALIDKIKEISQLITVKGYAGELTNESLFSNFTSGFPGVLVFIPRLDYIWQDNQFWYQEVNARFYIGAKSWYSQDSARSRGGYGVYEILESIREKLVGKNLSLQIMPIEIVSEGLVAADNIYVIYYADYKLKNPRLVYTMDNP